MTDEERLLMEAEVDMDETDDGDEPEPSTVEAVMADAAARLEERTIAPAA
jgi:hypothetical protein